ncbi:MAG: hypothetical protein CMB13_00355 [Euryarchaeota archaeon]|nr:hypothetical protein [Euryarchaeota archaeon]
MKRSDLEKRTVADLKVLLDAMGLPRSGKKSELIDRIIDSLRIDNQDTVQSDEDIESEIEEIVEDEGFLILEEDEVESIETTSEDTSSPIEPEVEEDSTEVIEATILEAVIVDSSTPKPRLESRNKPKTSVSSSDRKKSNQALFLGTLLLVAVLAGGGYWWTWMQDQQTFAVEPARYGDSMEFTMTGGSVQVNGNDMVALLRDNTGSALEKACGDLVITMNGMSSIAYRDAPTSEIGDPTDRDNAGSTETRDGYGRIHLAAERSLSYDLLADLSGRTWTTDGSRCSSSLTWEMNANSVDISVTSWEELTEATTIRSEATIDFVTPDGERSMLQNTAFGGTGITAIDDVLPLLLQPAVPLDLRSIFGSILLEEGLTGTADGWDYTVEATQRVNGEILVPIKMEQPSIATCLGHAKIDLLVREATPWPVEQKIDILIDKARESSDCSWHESTALDFAVPDGQLVITYTLRESTFTAGERAIVWGDLYNSRPGAGEGIPNTQAQWDGHMPDESTIHSFTVEEAVECLMNSSAGNGVRSALNNDGYLYKMHHTNDGAEESWNLSWVDPESDAGWTLVRSSGSDCTVVNDGTLAPSDAPEYNLNAVPNTLSIAEMQSRMMDPSDFLGATQILMDGGTLRSDVELTSRLVVTQDTGLLDFIDDIDEGEVTFTASRSWSDGTSEHSFDLIMDAERGRMVGWLQTTTE